MKKMITAFRRARNLAIRHGKALCYYDSSIEYKLGIGHTEIGWTAVAIPDLNNAIGIEIEKDWLAN